MTYCTTFERLLRTFDQSAPLNVLSPVPVNIIHCDFSSRNSNVLPGADHYECAEHHALFGPDTLAHAQSNTFFHESLQMPDCGIRCNTDFRYSLFAPAGKGKIRSLVIMLNGLNEKHWDKYLPWALRLVESTGKAVALFPIAFHMNRTLPEWSNPRIMSVVSAERKKLYPTIAHSSFANAAISTRLQAAPQRFFWSGLQTYLDIIQFVTQIRDGNHNHIDAKASIDFFAYSIGSFLSELILMTNPHGLFSDSRLFIFCGGPTLDRMYPGSRYIMDSEAVIALHAYLIEHLDNEFGRYPRLAHYFRDHHEIWDYFRAMLSNPKMKGLRENRFHALSEQIEALALKRDDVIPPVEVINTLQGDFRDIPIRVHVRDFPYPYSHVMPFPLRHSLSSQLDDCFDDVFEVVAAHLG
jgi:hypothetical protein